MGSPPRVRGTYHACIGIKVDSRITPARAGNIRIVLTMHRYRPDHPARAGTYQFRFERHIPSRITPARAGTSHDRRQTDLWITPACGEHSKMKQPGVTRRITPARAGTFRKFRRVVRVAGSPRACGEHPAPNGTPYAKGSPPRAGTSFERNHQGSIRRITPRVREHRHGRPLCVRLKGHPARAGNIAVRIQVVTVAEDHPRACGEHLSADMACITLIGSPPRVRGTFLR